MRKRIASILALVTLSVTGIVAGTTTQATAVITDPAIFFIPHQDDDVLTFGVDIKNHVLEGRRVIAVLLTDGSSSGLCISRYDNTDGVIGTYSQTDRAACSAERDAEFINAMNNLGAEPVIRADRMQDGTLTKAYATDVINEYLTLYPAASLKAQTYKESAHCTACANGTTGPGHVDHDAAGEALRSSLVVTADKRYYVKPSLWGTVTAGAYVSPRRVINGALLAYANFGAVSVPGEFDEQYGSTMQSTDPTNKTVSGADAWMHLPGA